MTSAGPGYVSRLMGMNVAHRGYLATDLHSANPRHRHLVICNEHKLCTPHQRHLILQKCLNFGGRWREAESDVGVGEKW